MSLYSVSLALTVWREISFFFILLRAGCHPSSCRHGTGQKTSNQRGADVLLECAYYFLHPNIHCRAINAECVTSLWARWYCLKRVSKLVSIRLTCGKTRANSLVFFLGVAAFLQIFEQKWSLAMVTALFWLLFSKLRWLCWVWCFFLFSRKSLLSKLCNFSFWPFALPVSNISKYYRDKGNFRICGLLFQFCLSFLCPILLEGLGFLLSVRPPLFGIAANFHHFLYLLSSWGFFQLFLPNFYHV